MRHLAGVFLFALILPISAQINVTTYQYDSTRAGANTNEVILNKANVNSTTFGKLFSQPVDGNIYGQPLYVANLAIPGNGTHNVVYVATENDTVYAFDADSATGPTSSPLWAVSFTNAAAIPVPSGDTSCGQITPEIGITSTPVIDTASGTIYVVAMTRETSGGSNTYVHRLHALDLASGSEKTGSPVTIQATYPGTGEGGSTLTFNPKDYKQRPGLLLLNGIVYTAWSSHCDIGKYHGWLIGYDAHTLAQVSVYNNTPNGNMGSFWAGGAAPAADASGNIYLVAGNGTFDYAQNGSDLGESYIKLSTSSGLAVADYFTPFNYADLNAGDADVGSAGVVLLGDEAGSAAHPHLMAGEGKEGRIYLLDRDNMGKLHSGSDSQTPQTIPGVAGLFGNPAYFNHMLYLCGSGGHLTAWSVSNAQLSKSSQASDQFGYPGCVPTISANGTSNAIVWVLEPLGGLRAYDATDLTRELFNTAQNPDRDATGATVKYSAPSVANGKVYAGRDSVLAVYGLEPGAPAIAVSSAASGDVGAVAPGSLVAIYGAGLAASTATASGFPLPLQLGGAAVSVGGISAPILYASSTQINLQIPPGVPPGNAAIAVSVNGAVTATTSMTIRAAAPGIFLLQQGRGAVVNQSGTINSPTQPASGGSVVSAYVTGLGTVSPAVTSGQPAPQTPVSRTDSTVTATIGNQTAQVQFAGLAPGFVGLYQVNILVPTLPAGQYVLSISAAGTASNIATLAVF